MTLEEVNVGGLNWKMHKLLIKNLNILMKANKKDWDFKILVSGDGMTRTGKTTIAGQTAKFVDPTATEDNWVYRGDKLIETALRLGHNKVVIYDEAREGLDSKKSMHSYSMNIINYFNECGYLNQWLILVLPDFFDLNKAVALNLSIFLINVHTVEGFDRGYFEFYNRKDKRYLYIKGKRYHDYSVQSPSFDGKFTDFFPFDYKVLELKKIEAIKDRRKTEEITGLAKKWKHRFVRVIKYLYDVDGHKQSKISEIASCNNDYIDEPAISRYLRTKM